eukprot:TRINITY_DN67407_c0_g1_i1.p1 TRINITY_DN67407_c0_g1~~TRINITY_DN67407_c0_g1_i1.p1  ORF type:complete len:1114 (-),score=223.41 TRINITY_DN67407_c0_g1_i1:726-4067(-)
MQWRFRLPILAVFLFEAAVLAIISAIAIYLLDDSASSSLLTIVRPLKHTSAHRAAISILSIVDSGHQALRPFAAKAAPFTKSTDFLREPNRGGIDSVVADLGLTTRLYGIGSGSGAIMFLYYSMEVGVTADGTAPQWADFVCFPQASAGNRRESSLRERVGASQQDLTAQEVMSLSHIDAGCLATLGNGRRIHSLITDAVVPDSHAAASPAPPSDEGARTDAFASSVETIPTLLNWTLGAVSNTYGEPYIVDIEKLTTEDAGGRFGAPYVFDQGENLEPRVLILVSFSIPLRFSTGPLYGVPSVLLPDGTEDVGSNYTLPPPTHTGDGLPIPLPNGLTTLEEAARVRQRCTLATSVDLELGYLSTLLRSLRSHDSERLVVFHVDLPEDESMAEDATTVDGWLDRLAYIGIGAPDPNLTAVQWGSAEGRASPKAPRHTPGRVMRRQGVNLQLRAVRESGDSVLDSTTPRLAAALRDRHMRRAVGDTTVPDDNIDGEWELLDLDGPNVFATATLLFGRGPGGSGSPGGRPFVTPWVVVQAIPRETYVGEYESARAEAIAVTASLTVLSVLLVIGISFAIYLPLQTLRKGLIAASALEFDEDENGTDTSTDSGGGGAKSVRRRPFSVLAEVDAMLSAYRTMSRQLRYSMQFVPEGLKAAMGGYADDVTESVVAAESMVAGQTCESSTASYADSFGRRRGRRRMSHHSKGEASASRRTSRASSARSSAHSASHNSSTATPAQILADGGLLTGASAREITVVGVLFPLNTSAYHRTLQTAVDAARARGGALLHMVGPIALFGFNTALRASLPGSLALEMAADLIDLMAGGAQAVRRPSEGVDSSAAVTRAHAPHGVDRGRGLTLLSSSHVRGLSVVSGYHAFGPIGVAGHMQMSSLSPVMERAIFLANVAALPRFAGARHTLTDQRTAEAIAVRWVVLPVAAVSHASFGDCPVPIGAMVASTLTEDDEWMYELEKKDPMTSAAASIWQTTGGPPEGWGMSEAVAKNVAAALLMGAEARVAQQTPGHHVVMRMDALDLARDFLCGTLVQPASGGPLSSVPPRTFGLADLGAKDPEIVRTATQSPIPPGGHDTVVGSPPKRPVGDVVMMDIDLTPPHPTS